jgi:predicted dehydrogenase
MKYRVGIIGCGRIANTIDDELQRPHRGGIILPLGHAGGYALVENTEMVAACDVVEDKLKTFQERWNVPRGYTDFRELIDTEKPDILSITTRPEQHVEAMVYGAEHGVKGMFAEKPLCCSLLEADAIRDAFERNDVKLEFGPPRRNWSVYRQAQEIATSGQLGEVKSVLGFSGNSIGGHFLDTLLYFLGDPEPVVSIRGVLGELNPAEGDTSNMRFVRDTGIRSALVEFENGKTLHVAGTGIGYDVEIVCEGGIIRLQNDGESLHVRKKDGSNRAYDPIPVSPRSPWSGTVLKIRELIESIETGKPAVSNLRITMLSTEIGFGLYESHLQGGLPVRPPIPNRDRVVSSW